MARKGATALGLSLNRVDGTWVAVAGSKSYDILVNGVKVSSTKTTTAFQNLVFKPGDRIGIRAQPSGTMQEATITYAQIAQPVPTPPAPTPSPAPAGALYPLSPWLYRRLPASPQKHPSSDAWMAKLGSNGIWPNGQQYGGAGAPTVYDVAKATRTLTLVETFAMPKTAKAKRPEHEVWAARPEHPRAGAGTSMSIPWNDAWVPGPTGDRQIMLIDYSTGICIQVQGLGTITKGASQLTCHSFATDNIKTGSGNSDPTNRVAVVPLGAGLNTVADYEGDYIRHVQRWAIDFAGTGWKTPAANSDGNTPGGPPSGAILYLPRSVDIEAYGVGPLGLKSLEGYQEFGTVIGDSGGGVSVSNQSTADGVTVYPGNIDAIPHELLAQFEFLAF